jgi:hypothetical protein
MSRQEISHDKMNIATVSMDTITSFKILLKWPANVRIKKEENEILRSQNATLRHGGHSKYLPYAFTEFR